MGSVEKFKGRLWYGRESMPITPTNPFKGRQYPGEVILSAVRWYLRYPRKLLADIAQDLTKGLPYRLCQLVRTGPLARALASDRQLQSDSDRQCRRQCPNQQNSSLAGCY